MKYVELILQVLSNVFGWMSQRLALKNTPEMKQNKKAQQAVEQDNKVATAIEKRDTATIEKELSE